MLVEQYRADIEAKCGLTNYTPIMYACQNADSETMNYLVGQGCDILATKSVAGRTAYKILADSRLSIPMTEQFAKQVEK